MIGIVLMIIVANVVNGTLIIDYKYSESNNCTGPITRVNARWNTTCNSTISPPVCRSNQKGTSKLWECVQTLDDIQVGYIKQTVYRGETCDSDDDIQFRALYLNNMCASGRHYECTVNDFILTMSNSPIDPLSGACSGTTVDIVTQPLGQCIEFAGKMTVFECGTPL